MGALKVYYDLMSQPCRALIIFLKMNNIPYEDKILALRKGEHMTDDFAKINPFQKVPVIEDDGFILTESVAIFQYLCATRPVANHWYPAQIRHRARIDEYSSWQQYNTRLNGAMVFRLQVIEPAVKQTPIDHHKVQKFKAELDVTLDHIENYFLRDSSFLCGGSDISIADLLAICELMQPYATGQDVSEGRPKLSGWMTRVKERLAPYFDDAHQIVYRVRENFLKSQSKM